MLQLALLNHCSMGPPVLHSLRAFTCAEASCCGLWSSGPCHRKLPFELRVLEGALNGFVREVGAGELAALSKDACFHTPCVRLSAEKGV